MTAVGISIDDLDQFMIAVSGTEILSRGYFEFRESCALCVGVTFSEASRPHSTPGRFLPALKDEREDALELAEELFYALNATSEMAGKPLPQFRACVLTLPTKLPTSQHELISSALMKNFGCADEASVTQEISAIISSLGIEPEDVEDSSIVVILGGFTYVLGEYSSTVVVLDTFPPPVNLELVISKHGIKKIIVVQDPNEPQLGRTHWANEIPVQYEPRDIIARGAAIMAALALPEPPVSILPLPLGIVLHGSLLHTVIPPFSVLPKKVEFTVTTVHDNQQTAAIEIREGLRARAEDNLPITKLLLKDIPPAPAGAVSIEVTVTVERYGDKIVVEAVESLSGSKAETVIERGDHVYPEGVLEDQRTAGETYSEEDAQFRASMSDTVARTTQPEDAVHLFVKPSIKHEDL